MVDAGGGVCITGLVFAARDSEALTGDVSLSETCISFGFGFCNLAPKSGQFNGGLSQGQEFLFAPSLFRLHSVRGGKHRLCVAGHDTDRMEAG